jgi:hypothetical protein
VTLRDLQTIAEDHEAREEKHQSDIFGEAGVDTRRILQRIAVNDVRQSEEIVRSKIRPRCVEVEAPLKAEHLNHRSGRAASTMKEYREI